MFNIIIYWIHEFSQELSILMRRIRMWHLLNIDLFDQMDLFLRKLSSSRGGSKSGLFFGTALQYKSSSPIKMWCIIYCVLHKLKVIKNNFQCQKTVLELHFSIRFDLDLEFWQNIDWIIVRRKSHLYLRAICNLNIEIYMSLLLCIWDKHL